MKTAETLPFYKNKMFFNLRNRAKLQTLMLCPRLIPGVSGHVGQVTGCGGRMGGAVHACRAAKLD